MIRTGTGILGLILLVQMALFTAVLGQSTISLAIAALILLTAVLAFVMDRGKRPNSSMAFVPVALYMLVFIMSTGYVLDYVHITPLIAQSSLPVAGFSALFGELGTVFSSVFLNGKAYGDSLEESGYDPEEIDSAIDSYTLSIGITGSVSLAVTVITLVVLGSTPYLDIGILPAIILFGIVYLIVFRFIVAERRRRIVKI